MSRINSAQLTFPLPPPLSLSPGRSSRLSLLALMSLARLRVGGPTTALGKRGKKKALYGLFSAEAADGMGAGRGPVQSPVGGKVWKRKGKAFFSCPKGGGECQHMRKALAICLDAGGGVGAYFLEEEKAPWKKKEAIIVVALSSGLLFPL